MLAHSLGLTKKPTTTLSEGQGSTTNKDHPYPDTASPFATLLMALEQPGLSHTGSPGVNNTGRDSAKTTPSTPQGAKVLTQQINPSPPRDTAMRSASSPALTGNFRQMFRADSPQTTVRTPQTPDIASVQSRQPVTQTPSEAVSRRLSSVTQPSNGLTKAGTQPSVGLTKAGTQTRVGTNIAGTQTLDGITGAGTMSTTRGDSAIASLHSQLSAGWTPLSQDHSLADSDVLPMSKGTTPTVSARNGKVTAWTDNAQPPSQTVDSTVPLTTRTGVSQGPDHTKTLLSNTHIGVATQGRPGQGRHADGQGTTPSTIAYQTDASSQTLQTSPDVQVSQGPSLDMTQPNWQGQLSAMIGGRIQSSAPTAWQVKVHPEGMGQLIISIAKHADGIHIRLEGTAAATVDMLSQHLSTLTDSLRNNGIDLSELQVSYRSSSGGLSQDGSSQSFQSNQQGQQGRWLQPFTGAASVNRPSHGSESTDVAGGLMNDRISIRV